MINVPQEVITEYLTDSVNKEIIIDGAHKSGMSLEDVNYYIGGINNEEINVYERTGSFNWVTLYSTNDTSAIDWGDVIEYRYLNDHNYIVIAMELEFVTLSGEFPSSANWELTYHKEGDSETIYTLNLGSADLAALTTSLTRVVFNFQKPSQISDIININLVPSTSFTATFDTRMSSYQVNFTDIEGYIPEYYKAPNFATFDPNDYGLYAIDNNNLIYEDFTLTESLCSRDNLKFGLCEAAHIEFSEVGINEVRVGDKIKAYSSLPGYPTSIPNPALEAINWADKSPYASIGVTYTWNMYYAAPLYTLDDDISEYIDYFNDRYIGYQLGLKVDNVTGTPEKPTYFKMRLRLEDEDGSTIGIYFNKFYTFADIETQETTISGIFPTIYGGKKIVKVKVLDLGFYKADKTLFSNGDTLAAHFIGRKFQLHSMRDMWDGTGDCPIPAYDTSAYYVYYGTIDNYLAQFSNRIPLGVFEVASVSNEYKHNVVRKKITAYDNLLVLENNAADWYTRYMFGIDFTEYNANGFQFARQIYATYFNYARKVGLEPWDKYNDVLIEDIPTYDTDKRVTWTTTNHGQLAYKSYVVEDVDPTILYKVEISNYDGMTDEEVIEAVNSHAQGFLENWDSLGRGVGSIASVLVKQTTPRGDIGILCDSGDYFVLEPDCTEFIVYVPYYYGYMQTNPSVMKLERIIQDVLIFRTVEPAPYLTNRETRLVYYNYGTKEIFSCNSSITGRDVVRSLLEVCGCFFRLDRYNGLPEFVYPTKGGLYPSNTLFPADDLYPRAGTDQLYSMGKYISVIAENYEVKDYGRIQILKDIKSSDAQSVVEWQYEGDPNAENTYIIDDNIFYCADGMMYDYDGMPEVAKMLEGMYERIANLGYVPNTTEALGAPWLECGDRVGLLTYDGGFETFVFRRTLKGIQNLRDTYESEGDELNPAISNFGYSV